MTQYCTSRRRQARALREQACALLLAAGAFWTASSVTGSPPAYASSDAISSGRPLVTPAHPVQLVLQTTRGPHKFHIEIRDDMPGRMAGLMHRTSMPADHGMLFDFGVEKEVAMWMKNTLLPLDMLFIRADGSIRSIASNTEPRSTRVISSNGPVRYVLELNAGAAARAGARPGDQVMHPAIRP